jgi:hypothetical protein
MRTTDRGRRRRLRPRRAARHRTDLEIDQHALLGGIAARCLNEFRGHPRGTPRLRVEGRFVRTRGRRRERPPGRDGPPPISRSGHVDGPLAAPPGLAGLVSLDRKRGLEIAVVIQVGASTTFVQVFSLRGRRLVGLDGPFLGQGGSVSHRSGVDCARKRGAILVSTQASLGPRRSSLSCGSAVLRAPEAVFSSGNHADRAVPAARTRARKVPGARRPDSAVSQLRGSDLS